MNELKIEGVGPHGRMVIEPTHEYGEAEYERDLMAMLGRDDDHARQAARRVLAFKLGVSASLVPDEAVDAAVLETRTRGAEAYGKRGLGLSALRAPRARRSSGSGGSKAQQDCEKMVSKNRARNKAARQARRKAR